MSEVARADAAWIKKALLAYSMGGEDKLDECLARGADPEVIATARRAREEYEGEYDHFFICNRAQPKRAEPEGGEAEVEPTPNHLKQEPKSGEAVVKLNRREGPSLKAKPEPLAEIVGALAVKAKPEAARALLRLRSWDEVKVPKGANAIEALTYVPGWVGDIVEWIVAGAIRPNRVMALGVALGVVGTLMGRRVEGPTGTGTHLYIFNLAPTGWGKDHPLWCGRKLMIEVGARGLLGPDEFVSGRGLIKFLKRKPLTLCLVDELGDVFQLINGQKDNQWVSDLMGIFKKLYNSWSIINTAESVRDEMVTINHPSVTLVGACTPEALFEALKPRDVQGGFVNRPMFLPYEGCKRPDERIVPEGMDEPPAALVRALKQLLPKRSILDEELGEDDEPAPPVARDQRQKIGWGTEEAQAVYLAFSKEMDGWEGKDQRKFELGMRAAENAIRCATVVAGGCFSPAVDLGDIEWALRWSRISFEAADSGLQKYMRDYFEFPKFCQEIVEAIRAAGGFMSERDLRRRFRRNMKFGFEFDKALAQLQMEARIKYATRRTGSRGREAVGWELGEE